MKQIVLVPHLNGIEEPCQNGLRLLEAAGLRVERLRGCSAIDSARCRMVSKALNQGYDSMLFIDADIGFYWQDAIDLLNRPEPVICGVYPAKGQPYFVVEFVDKEVIFGEKGSIYPLKYAAGGFLRIQSKVLKDMIDYFKFPLCDKSFWPFFQPMIINGDRYLGEDWSFSERCRMMGITPLADTRIRLHHWGQYGYTWEDTILRPKSSTFTHKV